MFSYRHGFHAGNHADVLKHLVQVQLLRHLLAKDKPFWVIDTHAGAGGYRLDGGFSARSGEAQSGIARLWRHTDGPEVLRDYLAQIRAYNGNGVLSRYPGSPQIAWQMLRPGDALRLFEAHPTEIVALRRHFDGADRRLLIQPGDGFAGLRSMLPPPARRGLVVIDPAYEMKGDYRALLDTLADALRRFATGLYLVWYPVISRPQARALPDRLRALAPGDWLDVRLTVRRARPDATGLHGSGVFVLNPPWRLEQALAEAMPVLVEALGEDELAGFDLDFRQS